MEHCSNGQKEHNKDNDDEEDNFNHPCDEINKRSIGKVMVKLCGNEGTKDTDEMATLRRLFQAVISHIPNERAFVWKDAEIAVFDDKCNIYKIKSGDGHTKFIVSMDNFGNPSIIHRQSMISCRYILRWSVEIGKDIACQILRSAPKLVSGAWDLLSWRTPAMPRGDPDTRATQVRPIEDTPASLHGVDTTREVGDTNFL